VLGDKKTFTFKQGRKAMAAWIEAQIESGSMDNEQLMCIFKPAQEPSQSQQ
jgi:hypothetical protein